MDRVNRTERNEARLLIGTASALLGLLSVVSCSDPLRGGRLGAGGATGRGGALGAGGLVGTGAGTIGGSSPTGGTTGAGGTTAAGDTPNTKLVAKAISASCAVLSDGTVQCWDGSVATTTTSLVPVAISGITNAIAIAEGRGDNSFGCVVLSGGMVQCWGDNSSGELGNGTTTDSSVPVTVSGITNAMAVARGNDTCAVLSDGTVQCWGDNTGGDLGNGTTTNSLVPMTVSGITSAIAVSVGGSAFACAVLSDGSVQWWGFDPFGFGSGPGGPGQSSVPVTFAGITSATAIAAGGGHACALLSGGTIQCWGFNAYGELGNGTTTDPPVPITVSGITNAIAIAAGEEHTCALLSGGSVQCWGDNSFGQLGNGSTNTCSYGSSRPCSLTPITVSGITNAIAIAASEMQTCALLSGGSVQCWGSYSSPFNDSVSFFSLMPVTVSGF
jgi:hypothetical protein